MKLSSLLLLLTSLFWLPSAHAQSETCVGAYNDTWYRGAVSWLCPGAGTVTSFTTASFPNDHISSLEIPSGYAAEICEHGNGGGECRTYFSSVHNMGDLFNDKASFIRVIRFNYNDFYMIMSSDPQYPWSCGNGHSDCDDETLATIDNEGQVAAMNALLRDLGRERLAGSIINGDLTAFGHDWQFDKYRQFYEKDLKINNYPGLGNHDISNNVDDCASNNCANRMALYLIDQVRSLNPKRFDLHEGDTYYRFPTRRKEYKNSLGYSWEIGNVHFVQLNNYPKYERKWNGWNLGSARRDYFDLTSAMNWLKTDLADAHSRGKKIVLNYHIPTNFYDPDFQKLMKDYDVSAIFAGHYHSTNGIYRTLNSFHGSGKHLPILLSGAAVYNNFLLVRFRGDSMEVQRVNSTGNGAYTLTAIGSFPLY
ncbi:metallophosphoesterase [Parendozoicomonas sp. Alg238-R29]|uniref:metallophosphoesterase n=1 Tax=Parendozoicomonas sp. Alg238-R29 TaxID=2993446 RepID=UPI00248E2422|nr:metallophosphoesterase [Parendozoicomonas sp. Alg238-R29]